MATVTFKSGDVQMADYTPGADVSAGDVIVQGDMLSIALVDIDSGDKGAVAINGGVWECPKDTGSGDALAAGTLVYWDATNEIVTSSASSHETFGYVVVAAAAATATADVTKVLP